MNELDQLTRFRDQVPLAVTPRAGQLFRAALREEHQPKRIVASRPRNPLTRIRAPWRLGIAAFVAAALVAGILVAVLPSGPPAVLTARLLADRASAAALARPAVSPGQWVYRVEAQHRGTPDAPNIITTAQWETADGLESYGPGSSNPADAPDAALLPFGARVPSYSQLGSLPRDPAALAAYLTRYVGSSQPYPQGAFLAIEEMLANYVLPPALEAEMYQALAAIPGVHVENHVTTIDSQTGVAFVVPPTRHSSKLEIILDASTYRFLAFGTWFSDSSFTETAVARMTIVGAPGSTRPSLTPPTAVELLAEQADRAAADDDDPMGVIVQPGTWIMRKLSTSSGDQTVWATADDSEQASYTGGKLQVCSRTAACAQSTQWLMPVGPRYQLVYPPLLQSRRPFRFAPGLPSSLPQLLTTLNSYRTGCADVAGDCNAVNAITNILAGYGGRNYRGPNGYWFLMLPDIPGVTVRPVTDVTGQRDVALHFPFVDGVTEILFNARTHEFAGYVRDGAETVITKQVTVSGPGSTKPVVFRPRYAPLPKG